MNMQKVMAWAKANWLIIVSCVVLVAALAAGPVFGSGMTKDLAARVKKNVDADYNALMRDRIDYTVPDPARPGASLVSESLVAHKLHTTRFAELRERMKAQTAEVWSKAVAHNQNDHTVLLEGLFPEPTVEDRRVLPGQFAREYIERAHQRLLDSIGAGMPPAPEKVLEDLQRYYNNQSTNMIEKRGGGELTPEEKQTLTEDLQKIRLSNYSQRASDVSVYADVSIFNLPPVPTERPSLQKCWDWQVRYWIHEDIVKAVAKANQASSGDRGVPGAVVKRLVLVQVEDRAGAGNVTDLPPREGALDPYTGHGSHGDYTDPFAGGRNPYGEGYGEGSDPYGGDPYGSGASGAEGAGAVTEEVGEEIAPRNFAVSVTGRTSGPGSGNKHYDVRYVNVDAVVSSERLPLFLDAIAQTNFMTVVDLDLESIEPTEHLSAGFYYGRDPVVNAKLRIETLWFREWTKPLMPPEVRTTLGIPAPEAPAEPAPDGQQEPAEGQDGYGPG